MEQLIVTVKVYSEVQFYKDQMRTMWSPPHRIMHDEVSETENIRKNLAIERMIVEGCEILLDTSQTFVRQGNSCHHVLSFRDKLRKPPVAQMSRISAAGDFLYLFSC